MLEATTADQKIIQTCDDQAATSDFSTSSDGVVENFLKEEYIHNSEMVSLDGDSLDEGLGDTSSDEAAESPVPNMCDQAMINSAKSPEKEEGRLSRIAYETPL